MLSQSISTKTMLMALLTVPYWQAAYDEYQGTSEHSTTIAFIPSPWYMNPTLNGSSAIQRFEDSKRSKYAME